MRYTTMTDVLKPGVFGNAAIEVFEVTPEEAAVSQFRARRSRGEYPVSTGKYVRLCVGSLLMMSDTQLEQRTNAEVVQRARGDVLIGGLGIGLIIRNILPKPEVTSVRVLEAYYDVIQLVTPQLSKLPGIEKLTVERVDALKRQPIPGETYDTIYWDIWSDISVGSLPDMTQLHRRWARRLRPGGWQNSWMRKELQARQRQLRRECNYS